VIVFSHALGSFAEQNTVLMEHLASHGYVVLAIGHPYVSMRTVSAAGEAVYVRLDKINELDAQLDAVDAELEPRIARAAADEERADLQLQRYERASGFNALMAVWVDDLRFALDALTAQDAVDPRLRSFASALDADRIGLLGMSFGGAAVTELCKSDVRCRAGMNMDGGSTFGRRQREPLQVPFLALVQEGSESLDYLLPASHGDFYKVEVRGAKHLDFTDDTVALPILKWLSITGDIAGERMLEITNAVALQFFDAYLRDNPTPRLTQFPELTVRTNVTSPE
jgi:predicted dienelactone hydrolase